ncbi:hypothetical protein Q5P01_004672 [Channa striata]|uniref:Tubulin polyglutamylase TTLL2 n=1 Tax=Channa striata TaxID=64152 RepID=A0AA88NF94_CHASR|nr:hypothetical protein Q5P01_004672 [Channa striata]
MAASLVFRLHDRGPALVREVLLERGWEEYDEGEQEEEDWNLYWRGSTFPNSEFQNLLPWQRLNHHPQTVGITRKDCLARNLRRMRAIFGSALYHFSPAAFILPTDYTRFLAEYNKLRRSRGPSVCWICKPVGLSRGRGIFLFDNTKDLVYDCSVIVQRYISNPLLVSGYKFDLRIYVCVQSFHPLTVYIHQEGLVRFATEKYSLSSLHNLFAHLTNTSINKFGPFYSSDKEKVGPGCKWTMSKFRHFLSGQDVNELLLWQRISNIVTLTLLAIAPTVPSCPNCVELFGFDILIDVKFKPWLLEVNYSPALTLDCPADITVKKGLISDLIDLMNYTSTDGLRESAYLSPKSKSHRFPANKISRVPTPELSKFKDPRTRKKTSGTKAPRTQGLPLLKSHYPPESSFRRRFGQHGLVADYQRRLPPVDLKKTHAAKGRVRNTAGPKNYTDKALNLQPRTKSRTNVSALAPWLSDNRSLHVSEVTNHDDAETEAEMGLAGETDVLSLIPNIPQRGRGFRQSAASWKLLNMHSGSRRPARFPPLEGAKVANGRHIPPLRAGNFIRTFPFNAATLTASRQKLDVRTVVHELHKLTAELASRKSAKTQCGRGEEAARKKTVVEAEGDFDSLLWGPADPPLLSEFLTAT